VASHSFSSAPAAYRLDELGWLQFERVCSLLLAADAGVDDVRWTGHADAERVALVDRPVTFATAGLRLERPVTVVVVWVAAEDSPERRIVSFMKRLAGLGSWCDDRLLVLTNLDGTAARAALQAAAWSEVRSVVVCGDRELGESLDRHPGVRAAMPSVLGSRDLSPLLSAGVRARSSLDVEQAQALARVFWPTRAYEHARVVLAQHRFVVLTGPPEMGKTAVAQMLALAQMTDGWEAHECNSPDQLWRVFDPSRRQVFVADDAFGSSRWVGY